MDNSNKNGRLQCELLAPAGNPEMLHASITAGADAAYLGLQSFNARRNAKNFDFESFTKACEYAHLRGSRIYVAMNTIVFDSELDQALGDASKAFEMGADAFIVQDIGFAYELRRRLPDVRLHASTQMSIHSESGLHMAAELGLDRVTLAREMSIGEIGHLCKEAEKLDLEIETFAHGALCISYSGQCLMSSMIGCRSANRGLCAQPCRLEYELIDRRDPERAAKTKGEHLLSPKDLCTIADIDELVDIGVSSLKIEGRMKSPEYAFTVVSIYRKQLDAALSAFRETAECQPPSQKDVDKLGSVFSRGFSSSYVSGNRGNSMMSYQRPNNRGQFVGRVKAVKDDNVEVSLEQPLKPGDICEIWTRKGNLVLNIGPDSDISKKSLLFQLEDVSSRKGHTSSYVFRPSKGDRVFRVRSADAQVDISEMDPRIPVDGVVEALLGSPLKVSFALAEDSSAVSARLYRRLAGRSVSSFAEGPEVEAARTKSVSAEEVYEHVNRMGQTPFVLRDLKIELDADVGMGFSQIHKVRAEALEKLQVAVLGALGYTDRSMDSSPLVGSAHVKTDGGKSKASVKKPTDESDIDICVHVANPECARAAKRNGATKIYVDALNYRRGTSQSCGVAEPDCSQAGYPKHCILVMGAISHDAYGQSRESMLGMQAWDSIREGSGVCVGSLDGIGQALDRSCELEIGPSFPAVNHETMNVLSAFGANRIWLSSELSLPQIDHLGKALANECPTCPDIGIIVAGAQELMTCEHCVLMSIGECDEDCPNCSRRHVPFALRDRMGYEFPVVTDHLGRSHIYNSLDTDNMNSIPNLIKSGVTSFMINAQLMDPEQTAQETSRLRLAVEKSVNDGGDIAKRKGTTTGHLHRPVA